mmetsp:Transcript_29269/g.67387  ORF Transcript_29269/g.67387 Transcript_29269/m.67387 type:complete len:266 (-) Transcript_29269:187-984(-)
MELITTIVLVCQRVFFSGFCGFRRGKVLCLLFRTEGCRSNAGLQLEQGWRDDRLVLIVAAIREHLINDLAHVDSRLPCPMELLSGSLRWGQVMCQQVKWHLSTLDLCRNKLGRASAHRRLLCPVDTALATESLGRRTWLCQGWEGLSVHNRWCFFHLTDLCAKPLTVSVEIECDTSASPTRCAHIAGMYKDATGIATSLWVVNLTVSLNPPVVAKHNQQDAAACTAQLFLGARLEGGRHVRHVHLRDSTPHAVSPGRTAGCSCCG